MEFLRSKNRRHILRLIRGELDDIYNFGIRQPLEQSGYVIERADEIQFAGGILDQIVKSIKQADLIVAETTDLNPNVYYEVGMSHAIGKGVILITQSVENLPFDIRGMRHITYNTAHELVGKLSKALQAMEKEPNNA